MNAKETEKTKEETTNHEKYFDLRRVTANTPALTPNPPAFQQEGYIPQYIQYLEKQNKADATIRGKFKILRVMIRARVNLLDPEEVSEMRNKPRFSDKM